MNKREYILGWNYRLHIKDTGIYKITNNHQDFLKGMKDCNDEIIRRTKQGSKQIYPKKLKEMK
jgi:hypothetical protein